MDRILFDIGSPLGVQHAESVQTSRKLPAKCTNLMVAISYVLREYQEADRGGGGSHCMAPNI